MFYTTLGYPDTNRLGKYLLSTWNKARKKVFWFSYSLIFKISSSDILKWIIKQKQKRWYLSCIFYYNPFEDQNTETESDRPEDGDNQTNGQLHTNGNTQACKLVLQKSSSFPISLATKESGDINCLDICILTAIFSFRKWDKRSSATMARIEYSLAIPREHTKIKGLIPKLPWY